MVVKAILTQSKKFLENLKINDLDIIAISKGINRNSGLETIHTNEKVLILIRGAKIFFFKD